MSLDFDYRKIRDFDNLTDNERVTRDALTWATMAVGIGDITEDNVGEFYARVSLWEKLFGTYRHGNGEPLYLTREDVARFVGLHTNVFPKEPQAKWLKRVFDVYARETERVNANA
jgi:hypothetical protein